MNFCVFRSRYKFHAIWVNAGMIVALMVKRQIGRDSSPQHLPYDAVRAYMLAISMDKSISAHILGTDPLPAMLGIFNFWPHHLI